MKPTFIRIFLYLWNASVFLTLQIQYLPFCLHFARLFLSRLSRTFVETLSKPKANLSYCQNAANRAVFLSICHLRNAILRTKSDCINDPLTVY